MSRIRPEWRWGLAAIAALGVGATCARTYAQLATPYYDFVAGVIAQMHPWKIDQVTVVDDPKSHGSVLRLTADVFRQNQDPRPAARVVSRIQVGEVVETPIVFWTLIVLWPARTIRQRMARALFAVPVFLGLEAATTGCQLVHSLSEASAILAGKSDAVTDWERWSRFLEGAGRFVLEVTAALVTIAMSSGRTLLHDWR